MLALLGDETAGTAGRGEGEPKIGACACLDGGRLGGRSVVGFYYSDEGSRNGARERWSSCRLRSDGGGSWRCRAREVALMRVHVRIGVPPFEFFFSLLLTKHSCLFG